jgi:hypothetical protein
VPEWRSPTLQRYGATRYDPLLSCWEGQAEGVDQAAERGETGLDRLRVWERGKVKPGQEQTGTDVGLQEQSQVVEVMLPASARVPGRMGFEWAQGAWRGSWGTMDAAVGREPTP